MFAAGAIFLTSEPSLFSRSQAPEIVQPWPQLSGQRALLVWTRAGNLMKKRSVLKASSSI